MKIIHISSVPDGAIVNFPHSLIPFMKVCNCKNGYGSVVDLDIGAHYTIPEIIAEYGEQAEVIANNIYEWAGV